VATFGGGLIASKVGGDLNGSEYRRKLWLYFANVSCLRGSVGDPSKETANLIEASSRYK